MTSSGVASWGLDVSSWIRAGRLLLHTYLASEEDDLMLSGGEQNIDDLVGDLYPVRYQRGSDKQEWRTHVRARQWQS